MPLDPVAQQLDFSAGAFQSGALEREPSGAAEKIVGLIGDDGLPYRRGGSTYKSNAAYGSGGLLMVADHTLAGGRRTMFGRTGSLGILGVDDATPAAVFASVYPAPFRPAVAAGIAAIDSRPNLYGGSRKTASYATTVAVTNGSRTVTGTGFTANVDAGMILQGTAGAANSSAAVQSVESDTSLTLYRAWPDATNATEAATFHYLFDMSVFVPISPVTAMASVANRLLMLGGGSLYFSSVNNLTNVAAGDFHTFPTVGIGLGVLRDVALVFTTGGVWAVSNMAYALTDAATGDPQHRKELVNADLVAWGHEGIASWAGALVVPCLDDVYLMDSLGAPTPVGGRILDLYLGYVRAGYRPGVAEVFNGHYFLPVLTAGNVWVDTLVCRLRPTHSGVAFGWSQLAGQGAEVAAFAERQTSPPLLLGAQARAASRVLSLGSYFVPSASVKADADGSAHSFQLVTIDYPTGGMVSNFVHHVRLVYALTDAGDAPSFAGEVSVDGGAWVALTGAGPASAGSVTWRVNRHAKNVRFRFTVSAAAADCKVKSVEVLVRHSGRQ